jgi:hypothetical protein
MICAIARSAFPAVAVYAFGLLKSTVGADSDDAGAS